jgi:hypothetical protein
VAGNSSIFGAEKIIELFLVAFSSTPHLMSPEAICLLEGACLCLKKEWFR